MLLTPKVLHEGTRAKLVHNGRTIGSIGAWKVCIWGDDTPYLSASACTIPALWVSAGLTSVSVVGRPLTRARNVAEMTITGEVKRIGRDVLSLGNIIIQGAAHVR